LPFVKWDAEISRGAPSIPVIAVMKSFSLIGFVNIMLSALCAVASPRNHPEGINSSFLMIDIKSPDSMKFGTTASF
jgi:hypothetical protein